MLGYSDYVDNEPTVLRCDNNGAIAFSTGNVKHSRMLGFEHKYYVVKHWGMYDILYVKVDTKDNIADMLTKALGNELFMKFRNTIMQYIQ
jgi:hypothetical protein